MPEARLPNLNLQEYLRYAMAGGTALLAISVAFPLLISAAGGVGLASSVLMLAAALVIGSLIYGLHRAVIYPLVYRMILRRVCRAMGGDAWNTYESEARGSIFRIGAPTPLERKLDWHRWNRGAGLAAQRTLSEWGAQIHMLYCSGIAVLATLALGTISFGTPQHPWLLGSVGLGLIAAGVPANLRLTHYDIAIALRAL